MRVLLTGATGFIGRHLRPALAQAGYAVRCAGRARPGDCDDWAPIDYTRATDPSAWTPHLQGVDAAINAVGILRERGAQTFDLLHHRAPLALFEACAAAGVRRVVQVSAVGATLGAASRYHRSKAQADAALLALPLEGIVVQPSLVFGPGGASARLFCTLASLPVLAVPGRGQQPLQPIHVDDLVDAILALLRAPVDAPCRIALVGPAPASYTAYLQRLRAVMGLGPAPVLHVPTPAMRLGAALGEHLPGSMLDRETLVMLDAGAAADAADTTRLLGREPRPIERFLSPAEAEAARTESQLAWLLVLLRVALAALWIGTGLVSLFGFPRAESYALLARTGIEGMLAPFALHGAALLDLALGIGVLVMKRRRWLWRAQIGLVLLYTAAITIGLPEYWLHPYAPVLKNLPLLAATYLALRLERA